MRSQHRPIPLLFAALPLALLGLRAARAQEDTSPPPAQSAAAQNTADNRPQNLLSLLNRLVYDADTRPPLIVVDAAQWFYGASLPEGRVEVTALTNRTDLRLVSAGHVNALIPRLMTVLNDHPPKANPFAGMRPDETLKLLLGTLTREQWRTIGSSEGLGIGDLTEDQRLLWAEVIPASMQVQTSTVQPGDTPNSRKYTDTTFVPVDHPESVRIRLNRQTTFQFFKSGTDDIGYLGAADRGEQTVGQTVHFLLRGPTKSDPMAQSSSSAYGVTLLSQEANKLKPSAIDYDSPSLDAPISLHFPPGPTVVPTKAATDAEIPAGFRQREMTDEEIAHLPASTRARITPALIAQMRARAAAIRADAAEVIAHRAELPTVGDLLRRVSAVTHFQFAADRRVRDLPVFLRGESARSGDILQALARSVTGAYRKLDGLHGAPQIYLLTSDIPGVGARADRLAEWASDAESLKYKAMQGIAERIAANDPLPSLTFAPGDKLALKPEWSKADEESWQLQKEEPTVKSQDLTPALREAADALAERAHESGIALRTDRLRLSEELTVSLVIPGIGEIKDRNIGQGVAWDFLKQISRNPARVAAMKKAAEKLTAAAAVALPPGFPAKLRRRVLLAKPASSEGAAALVRTAAKKGITDVWLLVDAADITAAGSLLKSAIKASAGPVAVGAAVSLLQNGGVPGEPERNIQGETGDEYRVRSQARWTTDADRASHDFDYGKYSGWIVPDRAEMATRLKALASLPGLSSLTLVSTAAPGWTGEKQGGDDILTELGYSLETRRDFLGAYGIDPIDIPQETYNLYNIVWDLGPFEIQPPSANFISTPKANAIAPDIAPRSAFLAFRARENVRMLAELHAALKKQAPALPLYLDDRVSPYGIQHPTSWFGSWDIADRVPVNPPFGGNSDQHAAARQASKTIFIDWGWWWNADYAASPGAASDFVVKVAAAADRNGSPAWDGMTLDMRKVPAADLLRLLEALPDAAPPAGSVIKR